MFLTDFFNALLHIGQTQNMTERQFLEKELQFWLTSPQRNMQITGDRYYKNHHDIEDKKRTIIGTDGQLATVYNLPNNIITDNRYGFLVDQKTNYLLAKPIEAKAGKEESQDAIKAIFGAQFRCTLKSVGADAMNCGVSYIFPWVDADGLHFKRFRGFEVLPFWADDEHTVLDAFARVYIQEVYEGQTKKFVQRVEWYKPEGVQRFIYEGGALKADSEDITPYFVIQNGDSTEGYNWGKVPLVAFKANSEEIPLIKRVKSLQDALNRLYSDFMDNMQEDKRNTILVIKNYDGEDLGEFRRNLATYGAVKVQSDGGIDTLQVDVNSDNYKTIVDLIKKAIIENGRGLDTKDERMSSGAPNQMNIQSMYNDIDLDADEMELEFQAGLEQLMWFVGKYLESRGQVAGQVEFIFNRDTMTNESETITNCRNSQGIISNETIVANHPWTKDTQAELDRMKKEKDENMATMAAGFGFPGSTGTGQSAGVGNE